MHRILVAIPILLARLLRLFLGLQNFRPQWVGKHLDPPIGLAPEGYPGT
jgi:hypothetical protein